MINTPLLINYALDYALKISPGRQIVTRTALWGGFSGSQIADTHLRRKAWYSVCARVWNDRDQSACHCRASKEPSDGFAASTAPGFPSPTQGYVVPGLEMRLVGDQGDIPWDGQQFGELLLRGPWVADSYYNDERSKNTFRSCSERVKNSDVRILQTTIENLMKFAISGNGCVIVQKCSGAYRPGLNGCQRATRPPHVP